MAYASTIESAPSFAVEDDLEDGSGMERMLGLDQQTTELTDLAYDFSETTTVHASGSSEQLTAEEVIAAEAGNFPDYELREMKGVETGQEMKMQLDATGELIKTFSDGTTSSSKEILEGNNEKHKTDFATMRDALLTDNFYRVVDFVNTVQPPTKLGGELQDATPTAELMITYYFRDPATGEVSMLILEADPLPHDESDYDLFDYGTYGDSVDDDDTKLPTLTSPVVALPVADTTTPSEASAALATATRIEEKPATLLVSNSSLLPTGSPLTVRARRTPAHETPAALPQMPEASARLSNNVDIQSETKPTPFSQETEKVSATSEVSTPPAVELAAEQEALVATAAAEPSQSAQSETATITLAPAQEPRPETLADTTDTIDEFDIPETLEPSETSQEQKTDTVISHKRIAVEATASIDHLPAVIALVPPTDTPEATMSNKTEQSAKSPADPGIILMRQDSAAVSFHEATAAAVEHADVPMEYEVTVKPETITTDAARNNHETFASTDRAELAPAQPIIRLLETQLPAQQPAAQLTARRTENTQTVPAAGKRGSNHIRPETLGISLISQARENTPRLIPILTRHVTNAPTPQRQVSFSRHERVPSKPAIRISRAPRIPIERPAAPEQVPVIEQVNELTRRPDDERSSRVVETTRPTAVPITITRPVVRQSNRATNPVTRTVRPAPTRFGPERESSLRRTRASNSGSLHDQTDLEQQAIINGIALARAA